jgi:hypothetical protein
MIQQIGTGTIYKAKCDPNHFHSPEWLVGQVPLQQDHFMSQCRRMPVIAIVL